MVVFTTQAFAAPISLWVRGEQLPLKVPPVIKNGRTLISLPTAARLLDAEISYDAATKEIVITKEGKRLTLTSGLKTAWINRQPATLDVPPQISGEHLLVPFRFLAEALDFFVIWDRNTETVHLSDNLLHLPGTAWPLTGTANASPHTHPGVQAVAGNRPPRGARSTRPTTSPEATRAAAQSAIRVAELPLPPTCRPSTSPPDTVWPPRSIGRSPSDPPHPAHGRSSPADSPWPSAPLHPPAAPDRW